MSKTDYIVIGSGISGMSFAHHASEKGKTVQVLERKDYAGGCVKSLRYEDFWMELGGHTIYNSYKTFIQTLRELEAEDTFLPREKASFKMYDNGQILPLMSSLNKLQAAFNVPKMFFLSKSGKTAREYYSSVLGKDNYENMFKPMLSAVISQDASDFPAGMLLKKRSRDKTAPRNFTLKGGMAGFIEKVANKDKVTVATNMEAVDITFNDGIYTVETACGEKFEAENLVMACPPPVAGKLLSNCSPDAASILSEISGAMVETIGIVVKKEDINVEPFSFIIAKDETFTSAVSRDIIPHEKYRGVSFHFKDGALDKEAKIAKIEDVLGLDRSAFLAQAETVHFSPTLGLEHRERLDRLHEALLKEDKLLIAGNYFGGLAIEDCALRSASLAKHKIES